jgi:outer membrane protein
VTRYALSLTRDETDAEDLVQETFLRAYAATNRLFRIESNRMGKLSRRRQRMGRQARSCTLNDEGHMRSRFCSSILTFASVAALAYALALSAQETQASSWRIVSGAAVMVFPEYAGSAEYRTLPLPITEITYRDRVYLGPGTNGLGLALGAYAIRKAHVDVAIEVGAQSDRRASRADALAGMDNRDWAAAGGASMTYRTGALEAGVGVVRGFNDGAGTLGNTTLSLSRPLGRLISTVGLGATFADARQMRRDFAVTPDEARRRQSLIDVGDPRLRPDEGSAYRPNGGLHHVSGTLSLIYVLSRRWALVSLGGIDGLSGAAQASPIVRRREQYWGISGLAYQF